MVNNTEHISMVSKVGWIRKSREERKGADEDVKLGNIDGNVAEENGLLVVLHNPVSWWELDLFNRRGRKRDAEGRKELLLLLCIK
jgi:hypothetical protein